ncbi:MAG: hypothetical protein CMJ93_04470 [Planctomycetes bacterium]|nr:hypothetical protein [Planctomycetota bacterium]
MQSAIKVLVGPIAAQIASGIELTELSELAMASKTAVSVYMNANACTFTGSMMETIHEDINVDNEVAFKQWCARLLDASVKQALFVDAVDKLSEDWERAGKCVVSGMNTSSLRDSHVHEYMKRVASILSVKENDRQDGESSSSENSLSGESGASEEEGEEEDDDESSDVSIDEEELKETAKSFGLVRKRKRE